MSEYRHITTQARWPLLCIIVAVYLGLVRSAVVCFMPFRKSTFVLIVTVHVHAEMLY